MKKLIFYILPVNFLLLGFSAWGQNVILGMPSYSGSGCPGGSVAATVSPDNDTLSILYDRFIVSNNGRMLNEVKASCRVVVPVTLPEGYGMRVMKLDYRGFHLVPRPPALAMLTTTGLQMYNRGSRVGSSPQTSTIRGPLNDIFFLTHNLDRQMNSGCGGTFNLEFTTELKITGGSGNRGAPLPLIGEAQMVLDSADLNSPDGSQEDGAHFQIQLFSCR